MALLPQPTVNVHGTIPEDAAKSVMTTGVWGDPAALQLVIQDAERAESYENTKAWVMSWNSATVLYQSPFTARYWEGTQTERANVPFFTLATVVNSVVPQIMNGIFYDDPPFMSQQRPGTTEAAARSAAEVLAYQLEEIGFREELRLGVINGVLFGTGIWKWGWETFTRERKLYKRKSASVVVKNQPGLPDIKTQADDDIEEEIIEEYIDRPTFEHMVNNRHVLVDPGLNVADIRKAKYVVHRMYLTWNDLDKLRNRPGFKIPSKETLLSLFFAPVEIPETNSSETSVRNPLWDARSEPRYKETTVDPFSQPLEVLERWDKDRYIVVLQKKLVICSDENPYGMIPFLSVGWWDVPEAFWSMGLAKTVGAEQRLQQGITNAWLDNLSLNLNGVYVKVRGKSVPTQSIRLAPGRIVDVDAQGDFEPLKRLESIPEAPQALQLSQARAESVSGANELITQGSIGGGGRSSITRTAAGVNALSGGTGARIQDFVEKLANQVMVPFLYSAHELNCALLPTQTLKYILDEELQKAYDGDIVDILNARMKFNISAAARLQSRRTMAQALPILTQFLMNQQIIDALATEGKKVNTAQVIRMMFEVSDWKNYRDVIVPMTPEDQQRYMAKQSGMQQQAQIGMKTQAASVLQQQKFQQEQQLVDQKNIARAANEVLRQSFEKAAEPEALTGAPGGTAFGSQA